MTRKKQIEEAADKQFTADYEDQFIGFIEGAKWADNNPDNTRISKFVDNQIEENKRLNRVVKGLCEEYGKLEISEIKLSAALEVAEEALNKINKLRGDK